MKENKGFTMVEVILVVAILAILSVGAATSIGYIHYGNTKKCAEAISSGLDETRIDTMSRADKPYLYLYRYNSVYYILKSTEKGRTVDNGQLRENGTRIGNGRLAISCKVAGGGSQLLDNNNYIRIAFLKSTGAFDSSAGNYEEILVEGNASYTIHLVQETGKHYME